MTRVPAIEAFPVRIEELRKVYASGKVAVSGASFTLRPAEVVGLLGPNGAGKSTTMKMLATVLKPTSGAIRFGGASLSLWEQPESVRLAIKRQIGWMPEQPLLYSWLTAREFLLFLGRLLDIPRGRLDARIDELIGFVRLGADADRFMIHYSYGMQRKVSLAAALLHDARLLLLDEPTAGVDPQGVRDIKDAIAAIRAQGKTVLVSTHILDTAEKICDRVVILTHGELAFAGDVEQLKRELQAPSCASLEDLFLELTHAQGERRAADGGGVV